MHATREILEETRDELTMTPMIDVTFLLLVFFLCSTRFKTFEEKLDSHLPKTGPSSQLIEDLRLPSEVHLGQTDTGVTLRLGQLHVADFDELEARLAARHSEDPELPVNLHAADGVHWEHVVHAFDTALAAGCDKVQFAVGSENEGISLDD